MILALMACSGAPPKTDDTAPIDDTAPTDDTGVPAACPEGDVVTFLGADGSVVDYTDTLLSGDYLTLDQPGTLEVCPGTWFARILIRADVTVKGLGADPAATILSGGESGTVLDVLGPDGILDVQNVTLDRGVGLDPDHNSGGGGIFCDAYGDVTVTDVVFSNNYANDGAGMYVTDCTSSLTGATFVDNLSDDDGGAFTVWYSNTTLDGVTFEGNTGLDGGAMAIFYGTATVSDSRFEDNTSTHVAGAIWVYNSTLTATDTRFVANDNAAGESGALYVYGSATLDGVEFADNAGLHGGGLWVYYESTVEATDCAFSGNTTDDVYAADYSEAGGVSYTGSAASTFSCAANVCTGL